MLKLRSIFLPLLILFAATASLAAKDKREHLKFSMGKENEWKIATSSGAPGGETTVEFVREGDDVQHWKELVTIQDLRKSASIKSPDITLEKLKALREKICPGATEWTIIDKQEDSVLYEWHQKACADQPEQSELARVLYGKQNVFFLHYAVKAHEFPPDARAEWIKRFNKAEIIEPEK